VPFLVVIMDSVRFSLCHVDLRHLVWSEGDATIGCAVIKSPETTDTLITGTARQTAATLVY